MLIHDFYEKTCHTDPDSLGYQLIQPVLDKITFNTYVVKVSATHEKLAFCLVTTKLVMHAQVSIYVRNYIVGAGKVKKTSSRQSKKR